LGAAAIASFLFDAGDGSVLEAIDDAIGRVGLPRSVLSCEFSSSWRASTCDLVTASDGRHQIASTATEVAQLRQRAGRVDYPKEEQSRQDEGQRCVCGMADDRARRGAPATIVLGTVIKVIPSARSNESSLLTSRSSSFPPAMRNRSRSGVISGFGT
jgi:hypothetical protein